MLEILDPNVTRSKFPSVVPLVIRFPNIVPEAKMQIHDDEWRKLSVEPLPFDHKDMEPEEFWGTLSDVKDGGGLLQFPTHCSFMSSLLSLPHAKVEVERIFSCVKLASM